MPTISLQVNGKPVSGEVQGNTLLTDFLRQNLGLTGTHVGCDTSQYGACVVHMNGNSVKSCTVLAAQADGAQITTIEGLAEGNSLHRLQQAFLDEGAIQCGYCTPGMILTAAALLNENPHPTDEQITDWMNGNICRCNGYTKIFNAIRRAAAQIAEVK